MKKIKLLLLFCLLSFSSFAANPRYMHLSVIYKGLSTTLFIIDENGKVEEQKLQALTNGFNVSNDKIIGVQKEIQDKLNNLATNGWKVEGISNIDNPQFIIVNYLLFKNEEPK